MKTFFGLLLLCGVVAVLVRGESLSGNAQSRADKGQCRLPVKPGVPGAAFHISFDEMQPSAHDVLMDFLEKQGSNYRLICVTCNIVKGSIYRVQYNRNKLVVINWHLDGSAEITHKGYVRDLYRS